MPLPTPSGGESHDDFVDRCMSEAADEFPDEEQRYAVCQSQWEESMSAQPEEQKREIPPKPSWHRAVPSLTLAPTAEMPRVDRENGVIYGGIMAQAGIFKDRRGEFNRKGLREIVRLNKQEPNGLKSRFAHPSLSDDGVGKFLGRWRDAKFGSAVVEKKAGEFVEVDVARGNLHFDRTAYSTPGGNLAEYVMSLVESDPSAINNSLVLQFKEEYRLKKDGTVEMDEDGNPLPPLWYPTELHACDVVDTGDATDSFLSIEALPDVAVREGAKLLDRFFAGQTRDTVRSRCLSWLDRYLLNRFGPPEEKGTPLLDALRDRLEEMALRQKRLAKK